MDKYDDLNNKKQVNHILSNILLNFPLGVHSSQIVDV